MRSRQFARPLSSLLAATLLLPLTSASPNPHLSAQAGFSFNELFGRYDCSGGTLCGYYDQLCCTTGSACYTGTDQIASCTAQAAAAASGGYWSQYTTTYVMTGYVTTTAVTSTYVNGAAATATIACAANNPPCGNICCASDQYCFTPGQCTAAAFGGSSGFAYTTTTHQTTAATPGAPILGTSKGTKVVTTTVGTTAFVPPVATGANITTSGQEVSSGHGLSGGAIAGIVIGVLLGLLLLGLILFCCCVGSIVDGFFGIFGLGRKRRVTEVEEYERRRHHSSGAGGGRTWWGGAARPPARVDREKNHEVRNVLGIAAILAAFFACLGLKRRREKKKEQDRYSEYTYSSDYYTSASSASSDERRTHATRYSRR